MDRYSDGDTYVVVGNVAYRRYKCIRYFGGVI